MLIVIVPDNGHCFYLLLFCSRCIQGDGFHVSFEGRTLVLFVPVPGICLLFCMQSFIGSHAYAKKCYKNGCKNDHFQMKICDICLISIELM